jgi:inner membrane protein
MIKSKIKNSLGVRVFVIGGISLLLLIPAMMIQGLITERQMTRNAAATEISSKWGARQNLSGPVLSVPFKAYYQTEKGEQITVVKYAHFLPDDFSVQGVMTPEIRNRGIYEAVLYGADLQLKATFPASDFSGLNIPAGDIMWSDAFIAIGLSDMKGINDMVKIGWNNQEFVADPGIESNDIFESGVSVKIPLDPKRSSFDFSTRLNLNGSSSLMFLPIGKESNIRLASAWQNPSFTGNFLPDVREVSTDGFTAEWKILHLNRNYPQKWVGKCQQNILYSAFGVNLLLPVDQYQKTMRTAKYAIMFILLTFLSFFMIELLNNKVLHPFQYLLIGFALVLFYTLLLSLSEHLGFDKAYWLAGAGILILVTGYTKSVLGNKIQTLLIAGVLTVLYGYLYIILQLQDYALLMGSLGLFIILANVMFLTRRVDWFTILKPEQPPIKQTT